jgi:hypothetical protein
MNQFPPRDRNKASFQKALRWKRVGKNQPAPDAADETLGSRARPVVPLFLPGQ